MSPEITKNTLKSQKKNYKLCQNYGIFNVFLNFKIMEIDKNYFLFGFWFYLKRLKSSVITLNCRKSSKKCAKSDFFYFFLFLRPYFFNTNSKITFLSFEVE